MLNNYKLKCSKEKVARVVAAARLLTHPTSLRWSTSLRLRRKEVGFGFS